MRSWQHVGSIVLAGAIASTAGCQKPAEKTDDQAAPSPKPAAAAGKCPAGSSGEATYEKPCVATGEVRLVALKYVSADDNYIVFEAKNNGPYELVGGQRSMWIYDGSGKRLDIAVPGGGPIKMATTSGTMSPTIKPGETKQVNFFLEKKRRPAGATTYQAELDRAEMATAGGSPDFVWKNADLHKEDRPLAK